MESIELISDRFIPKVMNFRSRACSKKQQMPFDRKMNKMSFFVFLFDKAFGIALRIFLALKHPVGDSEKASLVQRAVIRLLVSPQIARIFNKVLCVKMGS